MGERPYVRNGELWLDWKASSKHLFNRKVTEDIFETLSITPIRPLGQISDFVASKMQVETGVEEFDPDLINQVDENLKILNKQCMEGARKFLDGVSHPDIALLDLLLLKTFYKVYLQKTNQDLNVLIDLIAFHNQRVPQLTYEDLILINPLDKDPRVFFKGKIANDESDFYRWHNLIEQKFEPVIHAVFDVLEKCDEWSFWDEENKMLIETFNHERQAAMVLLGKFHRIDSKDFLTFRKSFVKDEEKNLRAASGAFSAWIPILDISIWLASLDNANPRYMDAVMNLYPRDGREFLRDARERVKHKETLLDYAERYNSKELYEMFLEIWEWIRRFRVSHISILKEVALDIYLGNMPWTGELSVEDFLKKNIEVTEKKLNEVKAKVATFTS